MSSNKSFQVTIDEQLGIQHQQCKHVNDLKIKQAREVAVRPKRSHRVTQYEHKLEHLQDYHHWLDDDQKSVELRNVRVGAEHEVAILDDVSDLTDDDEENFHHAAAVLEEHPEDGNAADMVDDVEECDLVPLLAEDEENRLRQLDDPEHQAPPHHVMNSVFDLVVLRLLDAPPSVAECEAVGVELKCLMENLDDERLASVRPLLRQLSQRCRRFGKRCRG